MSIQDKSFNESKIIDKTTYLFFKRLVDIFLSAIGIIVLSPVFIIVIILVRVDSKGPIFFGHSRKGKDGKPFKMWKFRSMVVNAEAKINELTPEQKKEFYENFKLENDPRITRVGKFIRKTSLDELPQLFNILIGEMSVIGPRPIVDEELKKYGENVNKFLCMKPGLTGYWAANGRSNTTYDERVAMELFYNDNCCFLLDVKIFLKTIYSVLKKDGAK